MPFGPVAPLDLVALEDKVLERWRDLDVVALVRDLRAGAEPWVFYEGPPTANGRPGIHHVWARVFKDLFPRFQTMQGMQVPRKGGWDCHGLPVELEVEKQLGLTSKSQIEDYGVAEFNKRCRASVQRYVRDWASLTARAGVWIDTDEAYWTLSNEYIESVWWLLKKMWEKGLLYEGHRVSPYCTRCGTALSSHEMGQPDVYRDVVDRAAYVRFPLRDLRSDLLVWTTTPWTLISNSAAAVGTAISYVQVRGKGGQRDLIMAADAVARVFGLESDHEVVSSFDGSELLGLRYSRPFADVPIDDSGGYIVEGDFVTATEGSGVVHIAPAFGEDDAAVGRSHGLPVPNPILPDGTFGPTVSWLQGVHVKDSHEPIVEELRVRGLLVREESIVHSYPHCWRCKSPLIYWAKTSWFARTSSARDALLRENDRVTWHPSHLKDGRFGKWLANNVDWALSRDRYWGTPLPIWRCASGHDTCVGSVAELQGLCPTDLTDIDLHRPYIDEITFACPTCGETATRLTAVLDAWFDSGSMPAAQEHFPFSAAVDNSLPRAYPAQFICEAIDQTRGWFYSLLAVNTLVFGTTPFENVVCLGLLVDDEGRKMSKSLGNVIDPWTIFQDHGADACRWWMFSHSQPWTPRRVASEAIRDASRQTLLTLWNVFSFFATYADIQQFAIRRSSFTPQHALDKWVLSELDFTITEVTEALESFDAMRGATSIASFIDDLSNWYVRRSRQRFWQPANEDAFVVLYECLCSVAELLAPFTPFFADELWVRLTGNTSVHAADWPQPRGLANSDARESMQAIRRLVALGRAARANADVRVRQPLSKAWVLHPGVDLDDASRREVMDELNVKSLDQISSLGGVVSRKVVPNFRVLGPRLGATVQEVAKQIAAMNGEELANELEANGFVTIGRERLGIDDLEIRVDADSRVALAQEGTFAVVLDLEINEALQEEGMARELIRIANDHRKLGGLEIADRVALVVEADTKLASTIERHRDWIAREVLASELLIGEAGDHAFRVDIAGHPARIHLTKWPP